MKEGGPGGKQKVSGPGEPQESARQSAGKEEPARAAPRRVRAVGTGSALQM